jgi:hypothetical protein
MKRTTGRHCRISPAAVKMATGRTLAQWLTVLKKRKTVGNRPRDNAAWLRDQHGLPAQFAEVIAAAHTQTLREQDQPRQNEGFTVSVSRTIAAPVSAVFAAWKDASSRARWLPGTSLAIRKATPHKSIRMTWADGSNLSVNFWPRGPIKCEVVPQHSKLPDEETAEKMKEYWTARLEGLAVFLEGK